MDIETRAAELIATWEHGDENHHQWLINIAMPELLALAAEIREATLEEALAVDPQKSDMWKHLTADEQDFFMSGVNRTKIAIRAIAIRELFAEEQS